MSAINNIPQKTTQQRISEININNLKNINDLKMSFEPHNLTVILGPNRSGKSTILHAIAACFSPVTGSAEGYKFSAFFLPHTDTQWKGSRLSITHSYRIESRVIDNEVKEFTKNTTRWIPRHERKPKRHVEYIGIDECVPLIEKENSKYNINYKTIQRDEKLIKDILEKASFVFNVRYTEYNKHSVSDKKYFFGVANSEMKYTALTMSAGEQKVFKILEKIFLAPDYSLILIDEIDLLLHDSAMIRLIDVINARAMSKKLQVIFTTHRDSVLKKSNEINVRHILTTPKKSFCFEQTKPEAIWRLTGEPAKPISIFVEDDLAAAIVSKISSNLKIAKYIEITKFGAASNCFLVAAGIAFKNEDFSNTLFVLDGDVYRTNEEKIDRIKAIITEHGEDIEMRRKQIIESIVDLNIPKEISPEEFINKSIGTIDTTNTPLEHHEIINIAREIRCVSDTHHYLDKIIEQIGLDKSVGLSKIIDVFSLTDEWNTYSESVRNWLSKKAESLLEDTSIV